MKERGIKERWPWFFDNENQPWIAAVAVLMLFCKWGFWPAWSRLQIQDSQLVERHRQVLSLKNRSPVMPADQVLALVEEWRSEFPFVLDQDPLEEAFSGSFGWRLHVQTEDLPYFFESLESQLSDRPLPVMWISLTMETGDVEIGVGDVQ